MPAQRGTFMSRPGGPPFAHTRTTPQGPGVPGPRFALLVFPLPGGSNAFRWRAQDYPQTPHPGSQQGAQRPQQAPGGDRPRPFPGRPAAPAPHTPGRDDRQFSPAGSDRGPALRPTGRDLAPRFCGRPGRGPRAGGRLHPRQVPPPSAKPRPAALARCPGAGDAGQAGAGLAAEEGQSWYLMADLRNLMSGIFTKAQEWELLPDSFANPMHRVRLPRKWEVRQKRMLSPEQTMRVLARLRDPVLLISQTCLETGARISEVTGLRIQHVDLKLGCVRIEQRHWRGDIDEPKTARSRRTLALGTLRERYRRWIAGLDEHSREGWVFPQQQDGKRPMWDSGVRKALKLAAEEEGCDFAGLGLHTLRRANITWRQEVRGSSIEAGQIAGHANSKMTGEYTVLQLRRQEELTRRLQEKLAQAGKGRGKTKK